MNSLLAASCPNVSCLFMVFLTNLSNNGSRFVFVRVAFDLLPPNAVFWPITDYLISILANTDFV